MSDLGESEPDQLVAGSTLPPPDRVLDAVPAAVATTDVGGVVLGWNRGAEQLYGWSAEEALGRGINELTLPHDWDPRAVLSALADGRAWAGEFTARHRDGAAFRASVTTSPVRDDSGTVVALVGVSTRVEDDDTTDHALRDLAAIVDSSSESIVGVDVEGVITSWNPASEVLFRWSAAEAVGTSILSMLPPDQAVALRGLFAELVVGGAVAQRETLGWRKDGSSFAVDMRLSAVRNGRGEVIGFAGLARDVSDRVALRRAAETESTRLHAAQTLAHVGSCELDLATGDIVWSDESWRILGLAPEPGAGFARLVAAVHPHDRSRVQAALDLVVTGVAPGAVEYRVVRPTGEVRRVREVFAVGTDGRGQPATVLGTKLDITEIWAAQEGRSTAEEILRQGFAHSAVGMLVSDGQGRTTTVNGAYLAIAGRTEAELLGTQGSDWVHPDDADTAAAHRDAMLRGELDTYSHEHRVLRPDGTVRWVHKTVSLIRGSGGEPAFFLGQVQDVTDRKQVEVDLVHQAFHDPLTALPNRALLTDRITQALARSGRVPGAVTALFLDVDQFKVVNDSIGHAAGDRLLVLVAQRLQAVVRPGDTLARFGGDEFVVVCEDVAPADVELLGARVTHAVREPFVLDGREVTVTVSAGIAAAGEGADAQSLLRDADAAMYQAKERGRNCVVLFDDAMHRRATDRLDTELQLRHARERDELVVHYQPLVEVPDGRPTGVEALVRWQHPTRGLLTPELFMAVAEETGLVVDIGEWVLGEALAQVQRWRTTLPGAAHLTVAVNLSARQVAEPGLAAAVRRVLEATGITPTAVHLEMTESVVMRDGALCVAVLTELRDLGVRLSVDDFGTGYSSLSYLKLLPVDTLKVDRSFVDGLGGDDPHDRSIVAAVLSLASALGLDVVAEGVETDAQLAELAALGVRRAQGHLWARPAPAEELEAWLRARTDPTGTPAS